MLGLICLVKPMTVDNSQFDEPFFDIGAYNVRMILLQVVNTRAKLHHSAVLKLFREALSESRRYQSSWISSEKQLRVRRLRQRAMRFLYG